MALSPETALANTEAAYTSIYDLFTRAAVIIGIIIAGIILTYLLARLLEKVSAVLLKHYTKSYDEISKIIHASMLIIGYGTTLLYSLSLLGIVTIVLYVLLAIVVLIILIISGVWLWYVIPNLIAYIVLFQSKIIRPGNSICMDHTEGKVLKKKLLETIIVTRLDDLIIIPNILMVKNKPKLKKEKL